MTRAPAAWLALASVLTLGAACPEPPRPQTEPREPHKEASAMEDPLRAFDRHPAATATIQFGTEHFGNGQITLVVRGDGAVSVDQRAASGLTQYTAKLDGAHVAAVGRALANHKFTAPRTSTMPRNPGDTQLVLRLSGAGVPAFETTIWYADRFKDQDLDAIMGIVEDLLYTASGGVLGQPAQSP